ncbi:hypothetical protein, partial [Cloacibacillus sp.]
MRNRRRARTPRNLGCPPHKTNHKLQLTFFLLLLIFTAFATLSLSWADDGNPPPNNDDVRQIATSGDLISFRDAVNAGSADINAKLMNDIDLSDSDGSPSEWIPVGQYTDKTPNGYAGSFDGGGFTVSGYIVASADAVSADKDGSLAAGFFGLAGQSAKIRGLTVSGVVSVDIGNDGIDIHAGGIAGRNNGGTISDCVSGGEVSASGGGGDHNSYAGGIAGDNDSGTITGCANNGEVSISYGFQNYAGGIAG